MNSCCSQLLCFIALIRRFTLHQGRREKKVPRRNDNWQVRRVHLSFRVDAGAYKEKTRESFPPTGCITMSRYVFNISSFFFSFCVFDLFLHTAQSAREAKVSTLSVSPLKQLLPSALAVPLGNVDNSCKPSPGDVLVQIQLTAKSIRAAASL